jgi:hypothetical protein
MHTQLLILSIALIGLFSCAAQAQVTDPLATNSPAKLGTNTFRFRPASIEFRDFGTRRQSFTVVIKIDDKKIPADYFVPQQRRLWDTDVEPFRQSLRDIMAKDDGYITVVDGILRERIPREKHAGHTNYWIDGRSLLGRIKTNLTKEK